MDLLNLPAGEGPALPFSAAAASGGLLFVSGQVPLVRGQLAGEDIRTQAGVAIDNLARVLALAGLDLGDVVKATVWLTSQADFAVFNEVYAERFGAHRPARSTVVNALALPGALIEIEAIAELRSPGRGAPSLDRDAGSGAQGGPDRGRS